MINEFRGYYQFLSNFYKVEIKIKNRTYKSLEHAYQAFKATNIADHDKIRLAPTPSSAKLLGRKIQIRDDWGNIRDNIMLYLLRLKFKNKNLRRMLLETRNEKIIESNSWKDTYWGVYKGAGQNKLGKLLMQVREELLK